MQLKRVLACSVIQFKQLQFLHTSLFAASGIFSMKLYLTQNLVPKAGQSASAEAFLEVN